MTALHSEIDALVAKLRLLPTERQEAAAEMLREITEDVYVLSEDELAVLRPALADDQAGRNIVFIEDCDARTRRVIDAGRGRLSRARGRRP